MADKDLPEQNAALAEPSDHRAARKERFLARWSSRKASVRVQKEPERPAAGATAENSSSADAALPALAEKTDADMPSIESLDANSDYAQFLSPRVSESLRRAALRKLFHQPRYNVMDGLDTYIADLRTFTPLGDTITADMRYQMERQAQAALALDSLEQKTSAAETKDRPPAAPGESAQAIETARQHPAQQSHTDKSRMHAIDPERADLSSPAEPDHGSGTAS